MGTAILKWISKTMSEEKQSKHNVNRKNPMINDSYHSPNDASLIAQFSYVFSQSRSRISKTIQLCIIQLMIGLLTF